MVKKTATPGQDTKLPPTRELFLRLYVAQGCQNAAKAYVEAGYSPNGAKQSAHQVLKDPAVRARLEILLRKQLTKVDITADRVMLELGRRAFSDIREIFDADGNLLPLTDLPDDAAAAIDGIEIVQEAAGGAKTVKVRRSGKDAALGLLARHFKIAGHEIDESIGKALAFAERLAAAREREQRLRK
jgi:phage terminase small subunit